MTAFLKLIITTSILLLNTSCVEKISKHGYFPESDKIEAIRINQSRQEILKPLIGSPALVMRDNGQEHWYYINNEKRSVAFLKPHFTKNNILKVSLENSIVVAVNQYDINDMNDIDFVRETTSKEKAKLGIFEQLFNNAGRFAENNDF